MDSNGAVPYPRAVARFATVRQSLLATFDACALEAHFEMSYRRGWSEHHQARGQIFHRVAARCLRAMHAMKEDTIPVGEALAILDEVLAQRDADKECPACGSGKILPGLSKFMERTCGDCGSLFETEFVNCPRRHVADLVWVTKKWANDNEFDIDHLIDVERRLQATVHYSVGGVPIERVVTGKPDVMLLDPADSQHVIVIDWKDTWGMPGKSEISEGGFFQQRFYAFLVMRNFKSVDRVTLREFYVRYSEVREATLWRHDLDQLENEFSALLEKFDRAFEEQVHPASPGKHCGWCLRPQKCPIPVFTRGDGRITTEARAKRVAGEIMVAERVVKKAKKELMAWCRDNGLVEVKNAKGKRVFGIVETERVDRPTKEMIEEAMLRAGGSLTRTEVEALYRKSKGTRFVDHAPAVEEGEDKTLIDSLAQSLARAAERKGIA